MADARRPIDRERLRRLPKAELHCHLDGSVRPETLIDLARQQGKNMPRSDANALREYMTVRDARNLEDYLARFDVTLSVLQRADALERVAFELVEDAHQDGVLYLETRFSPVLNVRGGLAPHEVVQAVASGLARGERETGVVARIIITAIRYMPVDTALQLAKLAVEYRGRGVAGFDLAGPEAGHPASRFATAFTWARDHGVACTCHAGEGDGAGSVREALHACGAHRIGHGTRLFEDRALEDECAEKRTPIEICITSNVQTRAAASYRQHPVRRYFDRGLHVVLNTDNRLMSATTLTDEYLHAANDVGFDFAELSRIALNGFESAFVDAPERERLLAQARAAIEKLSSDGSP